MNVEGKEVFRLRERSHDEQLVVDFLVLDKDGNKLAVIAKNNVVHAAAGFKFVNEPRCSSVVDQAGKVYARVREDETTGILSIVGDFWIEGFHIVVSAKELALGGASLSGNVIEGMGKALALTKGKIQIGLF